MFDVYSPHYRTTTHYTLNDLSQYYYVLNSIILYFTISKKVVGFKGLFPKEIMLKYTKEDNNEIVGITY